MHNLGRVTVTEPVRPPGGWPSRPVAHRQLLLFDAPPDLRRGRGIVGEPVDVVLAAALTNHVSDVAARNHWKPGYTSSVRSAIRILLALQSTPGASITPAEIEVLAQIRLPARTVRDVLAEVGMLDNDEVVIPAITRWFQRRTSELPDPIRDELAVWFDVMLSGSTIAPRRTGRSHTTIELYTTWALPALQRWAATGHRSLREISRDDVIAALPAAGIERSQIGRALRSVFAVLKARKMVFANPTARIHTASPTDKIPMPANLDDIAALLEDTDPARGAVAAVVVFHGLNAGQLRRLQLTDWRDRRLHIDGRSIPIAEPARVRLNAYLAHRHQRWPAASNPHLFINAVTAWRHEPVGYRWLKLTIDHPGGINTLRQDRILDEAIATRGDTRRLCDLFGLSITAASRYTNTIGHPDLAR